MESEGLSFILGLFMPIVIDFVNKRGWSTQLRYIVAFLICLATGAVVEYFNGRLSYGEVFQSAGIVFATAQSMYNLYWKDSVARTKVLAAK